MLARRDPSLRRAVLDLRLNAQLVGAVVRDVERRAAEHAAPVVFLDQVYAGVVFAGGRLRPRIETPFEEPVGRGGVALLEGRIAAWIGDAELQRRIGYGLQVAAPRDAEQAYRLARSVQPAIGIQRGQQPLRMVGVGLFAADVEALPAQPAIVAPVGHEGGVGAVPDHEYDRLLVAFQIACRRQTSVAARIGVLLGAPASRSCRAARRWRRPVVPRWLWSGRKHAGSYRRWSLPEGPDR